MAAIQKIFYVCRNCLGAKDLLSMKCGDIFCETCAKEVCVKRLRSPALCPVCKTEISMDTAKHIASTLYYQMQSCIAAAQNIAEADVNTSPSTNLRRNLPWRNKVASNLVKSTTHGISRRKRTANLRRNLPGQKHFATALYDQMQSCIAAAQMIAEADVNASPSTNLRRNLPGRNKGASNLLQSTTRAISRRETFANLRSNLPGRDIEACSLVQSTTAVSDIETFANLRSNLPGRDIEASSLVQCTTAVGDIETFPNLGSNLPGWDIEASSLVQCTTAVGDIETFPNLGSKLPGWDIETSSLVQPTTAVGDIETFANLRSNLPGRDIEASSSVQSTTAVGDIETFPNLRSNLPGWDIEACSLVQSTTAVGDIETFPNLRSNLPGRDIEASSLVQPTTAVGDRKKTAAEKKDYSDVEKNWKDNELPFTKSSQGVELHQNTSALEEEQTMDFIPDTEVIDSMEFSSDVCTRNESEENAGVRQTYEDDASSLVDRSSNANSITVKFHVKLSINMENIGEDIPRKIRDALLSANLRVHDINEVDIPLSHTTQHDSELVCETLEFKADENENATIGNIPGIYDINEVDIPLSHTTQHDSELVCETLEFKADENENATIGNIPGIYDINEVDIPLSHTTQHDSELVCETLEFKADENENATIGNIPGNGTELSPGIVVGNKTNPLFNGLALAETTNQDIVLIDSDEESEEAKFNKPNFDWNILQCVKYWTTVKLRPYGLYRDSNGTYHKIHDLSKKPKKSTRKFKKKTGNGQRASLYTARFESCKTNAIQEIPASALPNYEVTNTNSIISADNEQQTVTPSGLVKSSALVSDITTDLPVVDSHSPVKSEVTKVFNMEVEKISYPSVNTITSEDNNNMLEDNEKNILTPLTPSQKLPTCPGPLLVTHISIAQKASLVEFTRRFGVPILEKFDANVKYVVMGDQPHGYTRKILFGMANLCTFLSMQWIYACLGKGFVESVEPFVVHDKSFSVGTPDRLLSPFNFSLLGKPAFAVDDLKVLLEVCGGQFYPLDNFEVIHAPQKVKMILTFEPETFPKEYVAGIIESCRAPVVDFKFISDCIVNGELPIVTKYVRYSDQPEIDLDRFGYSLGSIFNSDEW